MVYMIDINIIAGFFAVASAILAYLYLTYKPPSCPKQAECPGCPESQGCPACQACPAAECPVQPPCPTFMGFELKGDYQEVLDLVNNIKDLNKELQDGICGHITGHVFDEHIATVTEAIRAQQQHNDLVNSNAQTQNFGSAFTCSTGAAHVQQNLLRHPSMTGNSGFGTTTKGKITIAIVKLISYMPDAICDASTGLIDIVKYESLLRNVYKAFCGSEIA
jgi:hypothetical protein